MPLPLPHLRLGQRERGNFRKQQAFKNVSLVVMGCGLLSGVPGIPLLPAFLIAHSVTAEPEAWGGEGTGLPAREQELSSNPKSQPETFLSGTSEPVLWQGEGTGLLSLTLTWSQVGVCSRASGTAGAVQPGFPAGYHAEAPCRPPSLWEWGTFYMVEGLGVKLLTAVGDRAGLTGVGLPA